MQLFISGKMEERKQIWKQKQKRDNWKHPSKFTVAVTYLIMVIVNALANILPINGIDTGAISDSYPNLFAPAGLTFSIWGVIYLLLLGYTLYQFGLFQGDKSKVKTELLRKIGIVFFCQFSSQRCLDLQLALPHDRPVGDLDAGDSA